MSNSLTFDGVDLSLYKLQVEDHSVPLMGDIVFAEHSAAFGDSEFTSVNHAKRNITLACTVTGTSQENLKNNMESILGTINPILGDKVFTLDDIPNRRFIGRVMGISEPSVKGRWGYSFSISLVALAHTQDLDETNASASIATDPDTLTVPVVRGNISRTPAEFYIRNETGAALTSATITLANNTTSETISWTGTLADDQWLRFGTLDSNGRFTASIALSDSTGSDPEAETYTSAISGYTSGDWPRLKGGVENSITVTGVSTGTLEWTYRGRYF